MWKGVDVIFMMEFKLVCISSGSICEFGFGISRIFFNSKSVHLRKKFQFKQKYERKRVKLVYTFENIHMRIKLTHMRCLGLLAYGTFVVIVSLTQYYFHAIISYEFPINDHKRIPTMFYLNTYGRKIPTIPVASCIAPMMHGFSFTNIMLFNYVKTICAIINENITLNLMFALHKFLLEYWKCSAILAKESP